MSPGSDCQYEPITATVVEVLILPVFRSSIGQCLRTWALGLTTWVQILTPLLTSSIPLGRLFNLSVLQYPHL